VTHEWKKTRLGPVSFWVRYGWNLRVKFVPISIHVGSGIRQVPYTHTQIDIPSATVDCSGVTGACQSAIADHHGAATLVRVPSTIRVQPLTVRMQPLTVRVPPAFVRVLPLTVRVSLILQH
jgi:hypothetical protein